MSVIQLVANLFGDSNYSVNAVTFARTQEKWYVVGSGPGSVSRVLESSDAIHWAELAIPNIGELFGCAGTDVATNRGRLVVVSDTKVYELDDVGNWSDVTPVGFAGGDSITYLSGTGFCAQGGAGNSFFFSNDGVTWNQINSTVSPLTDVISATPGFYASGTGNKNSYFAVGGVLWTDYSATSHAQADKFAYHNGELRWFAILKQTIPNNHYTVSKSDDFVGEFWTSIFTSAELNLGSYIVGFFPSVNSIIVFTGSSGDVAGLISEDGLTWDNFTIDNKLLVYTGISTGPDGMMVIIGNNGFGQARGVLTYIDRTSYFPATFRDAFPNTTIAAVEDLEADPSGVSNVQISFTSVNPVGDDVTGFLVTETNNATGVETIVAVIPSTGAGPYSTIIPASAEDVTYTVQTYSITLSDISVPVEVEFIVPDITVIGSGGIEFGGTAIMVFIYNPSGIYTLVPGKTHDTLYERISGIDSQNIKIPDPFIKTGYIPND